MESTSRGTLKIKGRGYHSEDLPIISQIATASGLTAVLIMALYLNSDEVIALYNEVPAGATLVEKNIDAEAFERWSQRAKEKWNKD